MTDNLDQDNLRVTKDGKVYYRGTKTYANLDMYEGEFVEGARHGNGRMRFFNGDRYEGEFERNLFHGYGVYLWNTMIDDDNNVIAGKKYEGEWKDGKKHGKGVFHLGNGDVYSGYFINDFYDGQGVLKLDNGDIYDGYWSRSKPNGKMKIALHNGETYDGLMAGGNFEGIGKYIYKNGLGKYEGTWHNGKPHGKGNRIFADGSRYTGEYFEGEIEGEGMKMFANGDQYLGFWRRGLMEGKGVYIHSNGDIYEGQFLQGVRYGEGKFTYKDGSYYQGEYRNLRPVSKLSASTSIPLPLCDGKRHGTGIRVWSNGARYEGQWVEDKMHGKGVYFDSFGAKFQGTFYNGLKRGKGVEEIGNIVAVEFVCPLGNRHYGSKYCKYVGEYFQGLYHGYGELYCCSGQWFKGQWFRGKKQGLGEQFFIRDGEMGDEHRYCIGGLGSMYRMRLFKGNYEDDRRDGPGIMTYTNGDTLEGGFVNGLPNGPIVYTFGKTKKIKLAVYDHGVRKEWVDLKQRVQNKPVPKKINSSANLSKLK